jgi:hypothetical protein
MKNTELQKINCEMENSLREALKIKLVTAQMFMRRLKTIEVYLFHQS